MSTHSAQYRKSNNEPINQSVGDSAHNK